jgi:hypothetical protein
VHLDLGLGVAGLAFAGERAAGQDAAVGGIAPLKVVELVEGGLASRGEEGEVPGGIGLEGLEDEAPYLGRGVGLLLFKLEQPLSPGFDDDLEGSVGLTRGSPRVRCEGQSQPCHPHPCSSSV